jgi:hypothetical protein
VRAAAGRAADCGACRRLRGVRAAATRAGTQAAVVGRAGGRWMHGESRGVHAAAAGGGARAAKRVARATEGNVG